MAKAGTEVRMGRKWQAAEDIQLARAWHQNRLVDMVKSASRREISLAPRSGSEIHCSTINEGLHRHTDSSKLNNFIRAGEQTTPATATSAGILAIAKDWTMSMDLQKQLKFPEHVITTNQRPGVVLWLDSTKHVILLELTVPWEENLEGL